MAVCYHCFREKDVAAVACPFCGYDPTGQEQKYPLALSPGSILNGRYIVGRVLGQGGFGITYIALDYQTKQRVAIKEYFPTEFAGRSGTLVQPYSEERDENFRYGMAQFLEEARTLAAVTGNQNIVHIHSYFEENGTAYFAMDYAEGLPLDEYIKSKGRRLSAAEADALLLPLMASLEQVHRRGIVHRDISPDNIIVAPDGTARLIDFGAARYSTGEKSKSLDVVLKHGFAPMEQYTRRGRQGPWTDVYAMAATYYFAVTGKVPPDAIDRISQDTLVAPRAAGAAVSPVQERALLKALEIQASNRWQDMGQFRAAMQTAQFATSASEAQPPEVPHTAPAPPAQAPVQPRAAAAAEEAGKKKRSPLPLIAAALVVVALGIFGVTKLTGDRGPAVTAPPAATEQPAETPAPTEAPPETPAPTEKPKKKNVSGENPELRTPFGLMMWDIEHNGAYYLTVDIRTAAYNTMRARNQHGKLELFSEDNEFGTTIGFNYADGYLYEATVSKSSALPYFFLYYRPEGQYDLSYGMDTDDDTKGKVAKYAAANQAAIRALGESLISEMSDNIMFFGESMKLNPVSCSQAPATDSAVSGKQLIPLELEETLPGLQNMEYELCVDDPDGTLPPGRYEVYARDADGSWFLFSTLVITAEQMDGRPVSYGLWGNEKRDVTAFSLPVYAKDSGENNADWSVELYYSIN